MKKLIIIAIFCIALAQAGSAQRAILTEADQLESEGKFREASQLLKNTVDSKKFPSAEVKRMEYELDRLARIRNDFSLTKEAQWNQLKRFVRGVTRDEFERWIKDGWLDNREIDGAVYFFDSGASNLFFRHPELNDRRIDAHDPASKEQLRYKLVTDIQKAARAQKTPYVLPKTFDVTMNVSADANAAPTGETVRAWIPIPRNYPFQTDFKFISTSPAPKNIADENSVIRSIYFEEPAVKDKQTRFRIEYQYKFYGVSFDLHPDKIQPYDPDDEAVKRYTSEAPHVVFTPGIKELSTKIVGDEKNPMLKAKKIYDWQSGHLHYSYSLEYSTIRNISDACRSRGYGDCGEQALLFITLCRYNGVPARWQSGWDLFPQDTSNHDWAEIYLAPYGWVPVDPYMGNYAMTYVRTLSMEQKKQMRDFYFGGLEQYRMAANSDHNQALDPVKQSFRSDDVDFQRGELEAGGKNIYLNRFSFNLNYKELPPQTVQ